MLEDFSAGFSNHWKTFFIGIFWLGLLHRRTGVRLLPGEGEGGVQQ